MIREVVSEVDTGQEFKNCIIVDAVTLGGQRLYFLFRKDGAILPLQSDLARNIAAQFNVEFSPFKAVD